MCARAESCAAQVSKTNHFRQYDRIETIQSSCSVIYVHRHTHIHIHFSNSIYVRTREINARPRALRSIAVPRAALIQPSASRSSWGQRWRRCLWAVYVCVCMFGMSGNTCLHLCAQHCTVCCRCMCHTVVVKWFWL